MLAIGAAPTRWREIAASTRRALGARQVRDSGGEPPAFLVAASTEGHRALPITALEKIGSGGLNTVYRTRDRVLYLPFIVRRPREARSAAELELLLQHDRIIEERLRKLPWHPVIPACFGRMRTGDDYCEVYEYAPGINLRSYVASRGLTYRAILDIAFSAARGLQHLHSHGLIHADLKPENFCVDERNLAAGRTVVCVWIIDFDIVTTPEELVEQIAVGAFSGTPGYIPPETFSTVVPEERHERERMAFAKDVFALGVSLGQIISGDVPELQSTQHTQSMPWPGRPLERVLCLPASVPAEFRDLVTAMCRESWRDRPSMADVAAALRRLRRRTDRAKGDRLIVEPRKRQVTRRFEEALAEGPSLGPYLVVNPDYAVRHAADGQPGRIMELEDAYGRRLLAIAFSFALARDAQAFYDGRRRLLLDLNRVRRAYPSLFMGTFSDLVRTEGGREGPFHVWFVRPLLPDALSLHELLEAEPHLSLKERVAILQRVADSLAALEDAGYVHRGISARSIFFMPYPTSTGGATLPFQDRGLFDVRGSRPYHQELMNMADVERAPENGAEDETVRDVLRLAVEIGVMDELSPDCADFLTQLRDAGTWAERGALLRWIEEECASGA